MSLGQSWAVCIKPTLFCAHVACVIKFDEPCWETSVEKWTPGSHTLCRASWGSSHHPCTVYRKKRKISLFNNKRTIPSVHCDPAAQLLLLCVALHHFEVDYYWATFEVGFFTPIKVRVGSWQPKSQTKGLSSNSSWEMQVFLVGTEQQTYKNLSPVGAAVKDMYGMAPFYSTRYFHRFVRMKLLDCKLCLCFLPPWSQDGCSELALLYDSVLH